MSLNVDEILVPVSAPLKAQYYPQLKREFEKNHYKAKLVPRNEYINDALKDNVPDEDIINGHIGHSPSSELNELLERYNINSICKMTFPQRVYNYEESPDTIKTGLNKIGTKGKLYRQKLHQLLDYFDKEYDQSQIPVQAEGAELYKLVLQVVANKHGIPAITLGFSPVKNHIGIYPDQSVNWSSISQSEYSEMDNEEISETTKFINSYLDNLKTTNKNDSASRTAWFKNNLKNIAELPPPLYKLINIYGPEAIERGLTRYSRNLSKTVKAQVYKKFAKNMPELNENYIFYPIQYYRESRVTLRAQPFFKQSWLINYLSNTKPTGFELFVKDHPEQLGALSLSEVASISTSGRLVKPDSSMFDILNNAGAIVVLNNTVGFEALLLGKPVVVLGNAFYSGNGYTHEPNNLNDISGVLSSAVDSDGLTENQIIEFAHGVLEGSYPGQMPPIGSKRCPKTVNSVLKFMDNLDDGYSPDHNF